MSGQKAVASSLSLWNVNRSHRLKLYCGEDAEEARTRVIDEEDCLPAASAGWTWSVLAVAGVCTFVGALAVAVVPAVCAMFAAITEWGNSLAGLSL